MTAPLPAKPDEHPLNLPIQDTPYDFAAIFGNDHPVELEVGSGKGRFLLTSAQEQPEINFLGIEWARKYWRLCLKRAAFRELQNIRFMRDDAAHTFELALSDRCLQAVHVYFPDPWPKKRYRKRRLIQTPFLDQVARVVKVGGLLKLATDHVDYFEQMDEVTAAHPKLEVIERLIGEDSREGITNYETKYREEGRTIHNITCRVLGE